MSVGLSIAFTGLCALVTDKDGRPGQVLLLDAHGIGAVQGTTLPDHAATLVMSLSDLANAETSGPTRVIVASPFSRLARTAPGTGDGPGGAGSLDQIGLWDLRGSEVRIVIQGGDAEGLTLFKASPGTTSWPGAPGDPHDPSAWRDLRFVADMASLAGDGRISPSLLGDEGVGTKGLPPAIAARIHLDAGVLEAAIPSQETYRDDVFEFRGDGTVSNLRQALTDTVRWALDTEAGAVVIEMVPVAGGPTKRLMLTPRATPYQAFISNLPAHNSSHPTHDALNDEEMAALHFGAYYKLLMNQPARVLLPSPWRAPLSPAAKGTGNIRTGFCPGALFARP